MSENTERSKRRKLTRELASLLAENVGGGRFRPRMPLDVPDDVECLFEANASTSSVSMDGAMKSSKTQNDSMSSSESLSSIEDNNCNILLSMKRLKDKIRSNLCCKKCAKQNMTDSLSSFVSFLTNYEAKLKQKAQDLKCKGHFDDQAGIFDNIKYLQYQLDHRPSPRDLLYMYKGELYEKKSNLHPPL